MAAAATSGGAPPSGSPAHREITSRPAARSWATRSRMLITWNGGTAARPATFTLGPFLSVGTAGTTAEVAWAGDLTGVGAAWGQRWPGGRGGPVSHSRSESHGAVLFLARSRRVARAPATTRQPTPPTIASPVPIRLSVSFPQVVPCASTV